jgi:hypothetical protein
MPRFGKDAILALNGGTSNTPVWNIVTAVRDVQIPDGEFAEIDASGKDAAIDLAEPGLMKISLEAKVRTNESDTNGFIALETAALARSSLDILILSGITTSNGARGFRFDAKIFKFFGEDQNIDQILWRPIRLKPCVPTNTPKSVVVANSAPVFTSLTLGFAY